MRAAVALAFATAAVCAPADEQIARFLSSAKILSAAPISKGVTKSLKAKLAAGKLTHLAHIQVINKELPPFVPEDGSRPVPMFDHWRYNIAAYRLSRLMGIDRVPVSIERTYLGKPAAFTWWVDDIVMDDGERRAKSVQPPDPERFERQMADARVFDELMMNTDRNLGNILIDRDWNIVLIDHTRTFAPYMGIRNAANLVRCSPELKNRMRGLTADSVKKAVGRYLTEQEVTALLARRDIILKLLR